MKKIMILVMLIFSSFLSVGLLRGFGQGTNEPPPNPKFGPADDFYLRSEPRIGCRQKTYSYSSDNDCNGPDGEKPFELAADSKGFVDMPRLASKFVADHDDTTVAITLSAMLNDGGDGGGPLLVRALVDGQQAEPGVIKMTERNYEDAAGYSFTFIAKVNKGIHTVQMQWSSEDRGDSVLLRDASLLVTLDSQDNAGQRLVAKARKPVTPITKNSMTWTAIPQTDLSFNLPEAGGVALTFSGVAKLERGVSFSVRAVIDNDPSLTSPYYTPFAINVFHPEARSLTFTSTRLNPGAHTVRIEWQSFATDVISTAVLEAWTVTALTSRGLTVVPQTVGMNVTQQSYVEVPTLATDLTVNELSDVAVTLSGYANGYSKVYATVMKDGDALKEQETLLYHPDLFFAPGQTDRPTNVMHQGVQSFTFALKDLPPGNKPYRISVALRIEGSGGWENQGTLVTNGTMTVLRKRRIGPDLAVGANMGAGSSKREAIIEPVYGKRKVLAIVFDPKRSDAPAVNNAYKQGIDDLLFGSNPSAKDYYQVVSDGRLQLDKVAVLGPYQGEKGDMPTPTDSNPYWDTDAYVCDETTPSYTDYRSPWDAQRAEALRQADDDFDFSAYDFDRNKVLTPNELAIIIVVPQNSNFATAVTWFRPYCDTTRKFKVHGVDGIEIPALIHMYTPGTTSTPENANGPLGSAMVAAHEMAHLILGLDDSYGNYTGIYKSDGTVLPCPEDDKSGCQKRFLSTAPHAVSMMSYATPTIDGGPSSPHLDAFHKLQLGWVTPRLLINPGAYHQQEVQQGKEVFILPREGTDAREYLLLETRFDKNVVLDPLYDHNLMDSGLAVYHVIEPGAACKAKGGASAPSCAPLQKPMCLTSDLVWNAVNSNFLRPGLRLIQPDMRHAINNNGSTNFSETLFGTNVGQDLLDAPLGGGGMSCPTEIGKAGGIPLLLWVDGTSSGYQLKSIRTDAAGQRTLFNVGITGK